ncbi:MAG: ArnT family glycosyltransferase [Acidimicrobiia bacterium]
MTRARSTFAVRLALIALGAFVVRAAIALYFDGRVQVSGDGLWYVGNAQFLPQGTGFIEPLHYISQGRAIASAAHPPLYALYLSVLDFLGVHDELVRRLWSAVPGVGTVVLCGLVARDLLDEWAGLVAAGIAAVSIALAVQDELLWSEGLYAFLVVATVWVAYRFVRAPSLGRVLLLGATIALATLTRAEAGLFVVVLLVPLVVRVVPDWRRRLAWTAAALAAMVVLIAPWSIYNQTRFAHPVPISVNLGGLLGSSNCPITYSGAGLGGWGATCARGLPRRMPDDESKAEILYRKAGLKYASEHADRLPVVIPVRLLRTFGFWHAPSIASADLSFDTVQKRWFGWVAMAEYWLLLVPAVVGFRYLWRRGPTTLPLLAPVVTTIVITIIGYGTLRFRIGVDAVLPILAALGIAALTARRRGVVPPDRDGAPAPDAGILTA